jgi:hypothetical protein
MRENQNQAVNTAGSVSRECGGCKAVERHVNIGTNLALWHMLAAAAVLWRAPPRCRVQPMVARAVMFTNYAAVTKKPTSRMCKIGSSFSFLRA